MCADNARHPDALTALVIIRDKSEYDQRSTIRSAALFKVVTSREGPRFALDHRAYQCEMDRGEIIADILSAIPDGAQLLVRVPELPRDYLAKGLTSGELPSPDVQLLSRTEPGLRLLPIECTESALERIAGFFAVPRANPDAPVTERARRAADEAQALWLAFLWSICGNSDRLCLTSAWEAWTAIERARPLPF